MTTIHAWNRFVGDATKANVISEYEDQRAEWTDSMGNTYTGIVWGVDMEPADNEDPIMHYKDATGAVLYEHLHEIRVFTARGV